MRYRVTTVMTVSAITHVEADSPEEALDKAADHQVMAIPANGGGDSEQEWVTELDGEPLLEQATVTEDP